jgi:prophage tail gpP-like protein
VLLASDPDGNLLFRIPAEEGINKNSFLRHRAIDKQNNVISYSTTFDNTGRFNRYQTISQSNATLFREGRGAGTPENQTGAVVEDDQIRKGRQLVLVAETPASGGENTPRAEWEANIRRSRGRTYDCVVEGFRDQEGKLWEVGSLVYVDDDFAGIHAHMRLNSLSFTFGGDGSTSSLSMLEPNAYTLELTPPPEQKMGENVVSKQFEEFKARRAQTDA